jgi:hypothetical protein
MASPGGVAVDAPGRDIPAAFDGLRGADRPARGGGRASSDDRDGSSVRGKPDEPESDRGSETSKGGGNASREGEDEEWPGWTGAPIGGPYEAEGRDAGAVTPGMASIGRTSGFGTVGRAVLGGAGAAGFGSAGFGAASDRLGWVAFALGGSSDGGSSGGGSWAIATLPRTRKRQSDRTVTNLVIAGSRLN